MERGKFRERGRGGSIVAAAATILAQGLINGRAEKRGRSRKVGQFFAAYLF